MSEASAFMDKSREPESQQLKRKLGAKHLLWQQIVDYVLEKYPGGKQEWNFPGKKYGWSFRIKDKKRAIIYLLPREGYFKVAFVFGQKATDEILASDLSIEIKTDLKQARKYAEGRGISIPVKDEKVMDAIKKLVQVKLAN